MSLVTTKAHGKPSKFSAQELVPETRTRNLDHVSCILVPVSCASGVQNLDPSFW